MRCFNITLLLHVVEIAQLKSLHWQGFCCLALLTVPATLRALCSTADQGGSSFLLTIQPFFGIFESAYPPSLFRSAERSILGGFSFSTGGSV
jgi:hypothetical protein